MVDSGATHNFVSTTMFETLKAAAQGVTWRYAAEPLRISLADNSVVSSSKIASIPLQFDEHELQTVDFRVVSKLNHPLILGLAWLRTHNPSIDWAALRINWQGKSSPVDLAAVKKPMPNYHAWLCTVQ